ncbi:MAG: hypothetical protein WC499_04100 [Patescibacteria group bacterium]
MTKTKRILVIFPRKLKQLEQEYIDNLKKDGHEVECLFLDIDTCDEIGLKSVEENERLIIWSQEIHILFKYCKDTNCKEFLFILGQIRMANRFREKELIIININDVFPTEQKSMENIILAMHYKLKPNSTLVNDLKKTINKQKGRD